MGNSSDELFTWWAIQNQRKGKFINYEAKDSIIKGVIASPSLQYYIVSKFLKKHWGIAGNLLNVIYDCITIALVYIITLFLLGNYENGFSFPPHLWAVLIFSTTPILLPINARLSGIKARTLGGLLSFIYFISLGTGLALKLKSAYILTCLSGIVIIVSSSFAMQNIVFISIFTSILYLNAEPLLLIVMSFIGALSTPKVGAYNILKQKWYHYKWYNNNYKGTTADKRNDFRSILKFPIILWKEPKKAIDQIIKRNTFIISVYSVPAFYLLVYYFTINFDTSFNLYQAPFIKFLFVMVASSLLVFILTSLRPFLFLGEAERYFEFSCPFISILLIIFAIEMGMNENVLFLLFIFQTSIVLLQYLYVLRKQFLQSLQPPLLDRSTQELIKYINDSTKRLRILTIPFKISYALSFYLKESDHKIYHMFLSPDNGTGFEYMKDDSEIYNWPKRELLLFKNKYDINLVIHLKSSKTTMEKYDVRYDELSDLTCLYENDKYKVYQL